jgi:hypothetical protein
MWTMSTQELSITANSRDASRASTPVSSASLAAQCATPVK